MRRRSRQREAIREVFAENDRPLSPGEVLDLAGSRKPGLGIATVYRTLKSLLEEGSVVAVEMPGQALRYEAAGKEHHHHFHCRGCGRVFEVEGCPTGIGRLTPPGFRLEGHEIVLHGLCPDCD